jgi:ribonuclease E
MVTIVPDKAVRWVGRSLSAVLVWLQLAAVPAASRLVAAVVVPAAEAAVVVAAPPVEAVVGARAQLVAAAEPAAPREAEAAVRGQPEVAAEPAAAVAAEPAAPQEAVVVPTILAAVEAAWIVSRLAAECAQLAVTVAAKAAFARREPRGAQSRPWRRAAVSARLEAVAATEGRRSWSLTQASSCPARPSRWQVRSEVSERQSAIACRPAVACCCWAAMVDHRSRRAAVVRAACC